MRIPELECDLLVVGGGMVGAALALACSAQGLKIIVVESREPSRDWPKGEVDLRVSALSRASQRILNRLGRGPTAWERIQGLGVSPYREMRVWDAVGGASIHFDSADLGEPDLGHIVENRVTQLALWEQLEVAPDIHLLCPARGLRLSLTSERAQLDLDDGRRLVARLLVGADGRDSWVRAQAGITTSGWDYDQQAIVANVQTTRPHGETAWQRFLPTGPLAFLPLADGRCSIVWSVVESRARQFMALEDAAFLAELEAACERHLGPLVAVGSRESFPLRLQHADQYVLPRLALVGDAAHAIHPLAGQGVNLGFLDAAQLADNIAEALAKGRDIGSLWTLRRYERARRGGNMGMLGAMEVFKRLFGNRNPLLVAARNLGLAVTDRLPGLKQLFIEQALGQGENVPSLARP